MTFEELVATIDENRKRIGELQAMIRDAQNALSCVNYLPYLIEDAQRILEKNTAQPGNISDEKFDAIRRRIDDAVAALESNDPSEVTGAYLTLSSHILQFVASVDRS